MKIVWDCPYQSWNLLNTEGGGVKLISAFILAEHVPRYTHDGVAGYLPPGIFPPRGGDT